MSKFFFSLSLLALQTAIAAPFAFVSGQMSGGPTTTVPDVDSVNVIDLSDNSYVKTFPYPSEFAPLAPQPLGIAITPDGKWIYVANARIASVCAINTLSGEFVTIPVGGFPGFIAITPDGKRAFVSCFNDGVWVIDVASNTVIQEILLPHLPLNIALTPDGSRAYVPLAEEISPGFGGYFAINTADYSVSGPFPVPELASPPAPIFDGLRGIAITKDGKGAFMTSRNQNAVYKINLQTNAVEIITNAQLQSPLLAALTPDNRYLYVTEESGSPTALYKMKTTFPYITKKIILDNFSFSRSLGVAVSPDGKKVLVAYGNKVAVVSTETDAILDVPIVGDFDMFGPLIMKDICIGVFGSPSPIPVIDTPVSVRACANQNHFLSQTELFNVVTWDKPATINPVRYQVYRDVQLTCLAGEVCCPELIDGNRRRNTQNNYYIVAVSGDGSRILIGQTTVCSH